MEKILRAFKNEVFKASVFLPVKKSSSRIVEEVLGSKNERELKLRIKTYEEAEKKYCKEKFKALIEKMSLEDCTESLWRLGIGCAIAYDKRESSTKKEKLTKFDFLIDLTQTLLYVMENDGIRLTKLTKSKTHGDTKKHVDILSQSYIDFVKKCLLKKFREKGLDLIQISEDEALLDLKSGAYNEWIKIYLKKRQLWYSDNDDDCADQLTDEVLEEVVDDEMVEIFCMEMANYTYIDVDFIKSKLEELKASRTNIIKGASINNYHIVYLLQVFLPLLKYKASSDNCQLIFEFCQIFQLKLDKESKKTHFTSENIRRTYNDYKAIFCRNEEN